MGAKEVAAGAYWLDSNFPGWEREIDLGTLNLNDCAECVCGQSLAKFVNRQFATGFDIAMKRIVGTDNWRVNRIHGRQWAKEHGFDSDCFRENTALEVLWRELIKERFSSGNLSDLQED